ncbi:MAG: hypothetical protein N2450_05350 [bacterium]|nr:hypothetical protein [bacterium]
MNLSDLWLRLGYWLAKQRYKNYIRKDETYSFQQGLKIKKILLCMPDYSNQVPEAANTINYVKSYFQNCELKVIFYDAIEANIPNEYRSWGMMTNSSFDIFGIPKRTFIESIRSEKCDIAIDLACPTNEVNDILCLLSGCKWHASLEYKGMDANFLSSANIKVVAKNETSREQQYRTLFRILANLQNPLKQVRT